MRMPADWPQARRSLHVARMPVDRATDVGCVGQHAALSRGMPVALVSPCLATGRGQATADLAQTHPLQRNPFKHPSDEACLFLDDLEARCPTAISLRHVAIAVGGCGKGAEQAGTRSMPAATAATLQDLRSLVLRDDPLHLQQQIILGRAANRVIEEDHFGASTAELLDEQDLMSIAPCKAIRSMDVKALYQSHGNRVAQSLQCRANQACPAVPFVDVGVLGQHAITLGSDPLVQRSDLTGNRVVARLLVRRHARIEGDAVANHAYLRAFGWGWQFGPSSRACSCRSPRSGAERGAHTHPAGTAGRGVSSRTCPASRGTGGSRAGASAPPS